MSSIELKELKEYWTKKYPHVAVTLWESTTEQQYFGKMWTPNLGQNLSASTIGELISQGEAFLRSVT